MCAHLIERAADDEKAQDVEQKLRSITRVKDIVVLVLVAQEKTADLVVDWQVVHCLGDAPGNRPVPSYGAACCQSVEERERQLAGLDGLRRDRLGCPLAPQNTPRALLGGQHLEVGQHLAVIEEILLLCAFVRLLLIVDEDTFRKISAS